LGAYRSFESEVKYKNEILPGEQPPIMDRALFEAVRQKSLAQWSHRKAPGASGQRNRARRTRARTWDPLIKSRVIFQCLQRISQKTN
jgi:hypothetical protein